MLCCHEPIISGMLECKPGSGGVIFPMMVLMHEFYFGESRDKNISNKLATRGNPWTILSSTF